MHRRANRSDRQAGRQAGAGAADGTLDRRAARHEGEAVPYPLLGRVVRAVQERRAAAQLSCKEHGSKDMFGYPVAVFPYCIEVDEQGNVAKHGSLREVLRLDSEVVSTADLRPNVSGAVLGTEPDGGLVAVSLGEADGVRKGQFFDAMRDSRRIAQLRIVFVSKNRCVGKIVDEKVKASVNKGDVVRRPMAVGAG